jgi:APA family basic amino acid/polyamine antiporter
LIKIAILYFFVGFGLFHIDLQNFSSFSPNGVFGILEGAGFIFLAYIGFGRIATLGEEVKNPQQTLSLSILLALTLSVIIYILTGFTATGLLDYRVLAQSGSPIADAAKVIGNNALVAAVSLGALIATVSVLLTNLIGLSRVSFAMARDGQLPKTAAKMSSRFGTPYISILIKGAITAFLPLVLDLKQAVAMTSFGILFTHVVVNFSAIRLRKKMSHSTTFRAPLYPLIPFLGILSCIILMFSLPEESWIVAAMIIVASAGFYYLRSKRRLKKATLALKNR